MWRYINEILSFYFRKYIFDLFRIKACNDLLRIFKFISRCTFNTVNKVKLEVKLEIQFSKMA